MGLYHINTMQSSKWNSVNSKTPERHIVLYITITILLFLPGLRYIVITPVFLHQYLPNLVNHSGLPTSYIVTPGLPGSPNLLGLAVLQGLQGLPYLQGLQGLPD